ncbi:MAG: hypothetical protein COA49_07685 [Bacteroidetes bacterium]|nr:MAG: hypothetical protein COA49_07685 [Bacteroidota bacterium]
MKVNLLSMLNLIRVNTFFVTTLLVIMFLTSMTNVIAQETEPSPWSRFGLGLTTPTLSPPQLMMGGVSSPILDGYTINPDQPASAAGCITTQFQSSIHGTRSNMTEGDSTASITSGSPGAISLVIKKPGSSSAVMMGMMPYSGKGYSVSRTFTDTLIGSDILEKYSGSGGIAKSYLGAATSFKGKKWISAGDNDSVLVSNRSMFLGAQVSFLFGEVTSTGRLDIEDVTYLDNRTRTSMRHRSLGALLGVQGFQLLWANYDDQRNFQSSATLYAGATYSPSSVLLTDYEKTVETVQILSSVETVIDTASYINLIDASGRIPSKISAGGSIVFEKANGRRIQLSADYMKEDWSSVSDEFEVNILGGDATWAKASRSSMGIAFKPKSNGVAKTILSRSTYKAGFALDAYPIAYRGTQLSGWRASAGITIPLEGSRSISRFHFGVEMGQRGLGINNGTVLEGTLKESLFNIQLGVTLAPFFKNLWLTPKLYD